MEERTGLSEQELRELTRGVPPYMQMVVEACARRVRDGASESSGAQDRVCLQTFSAIWRSKGIV